MSLIILSIPFGMLLPKEIEVKLAPVIFQSLLGCFLQLLMTQILLTIHFFQSLLGCFPRHAENWDRIWHYFQSLLGCFKIIYFVDGLDDWFFQSLLGCFGTAFLRADVGIMGYFQSLLGCFYHVFLHSRTSMIKPFNPFWDASIDADIDVTITKNFQSLLGCFTGQSRSGNRCTPLSIPFGMLHLKIRTDTKGLLSFNPFWDASFAITYLEEDRNKLSFNPFWDASLIGTSPLLDDQYTFNPFWDASHGRTLYLRTDLVNFQSLLGCFRDCSIC